MSGSQGASLPAHRVQNRFVFLDVFRAVAPLLVIYSHIVTMFLDERNLHSPVVEIINSQVRDPLRLEQNLGHIAVVMFFLVSGFIITHIGTQESHREFGIKRVFRVYPLLMFVVLVTACLGSLGLKVMTTGQLFVVEPRFVVTNLFLINYFQVPQVLLVGVAWTLVIEVIFYSMVFVLLALLRRWTWVAILIELFLVLVVLLLARELGDSFFLFAVSVSYLPVVIMGQITWAVWNGRIPLWAGTSIGALAWLLYVLGDRWGMGRIDAAYSSTFALGFCLFLAFLLLEPKLRPTKVVSFFADRSYSLYLMHGPVAFPLMDTLVGRVPLVVAIVAGVTATVAASELTFRFIELPAQRFARRITRRFRLRPPSRPKHSRRPGRPASAMRSSFADADAATTQPIVNGLFDRPVQNFGEQGHGHDRGSNRKLRT